MVWGLKRPGGFGDYFPDGEYVGWREQLVEYFNTQMTDAEKSEMGMEEYFNGTATSNKFTQDLGPIKEHEWPKNLHTVKTYKNLGSLMTSENGLLLVDEALKDIIEKLEPDLHQFNPVKITMAKGVEYPKQYYVMVIRQFLDSFSPEESVEGVWRDASFDAYWGERIERYFVDIPKKHYYVGLALQCLKFKNSHLWIEQKLKDPDIYFSDELVDEIKRQSLRMPPQFYQLREV